jgi:hypothetical protein
MSGFAALSAKLRTPEHAERLNYLPVDLTI